MRASVSPRQSARLASFWSIRADAGGAGVEFALVIAVSSEMRLSSAAQQGLGSPCGPYPEAAKRVEQPQNEADAGGPQPKDGGVPGELRFQEREGDGANEQDGSGRRQHEAGPWQLTDHAGTREGINCPGEKHRG